MWYLKVYGATLLAFASVDAAWLILVANAFFKKELGGLLRAQPDLAAAAVFYLVYAGGMVVLVVAPALRERSAQNAAWKGAVLGLTAYSTFDLTNLAIIQGWTLAVAFVDVTWGTIASALASLVAYRVGSTADASAR
jgi:uncharacterized membrane protein